MSMSAKFDQRSTIDDLKRSISVSEGIPVSHLRLLHGIHELGADSVMCMAGETITVLGRLNGGVKHQGNACSYIDSQNNPKVMPMMWWLGFGRSYQDGRTGEEGRICHILSQFTFLKSTPGMWQEGQIPRWWYSDRPLCDWKSITLISTSLLPCNMIDGVIRGIGALEIRKCRLASLPESIENLSSLTILDAVDNKLTLLPESIGNLSLMTQLNVSENRLTELPESIGNLSSLTCLRVHSNRLTILPESIGNLSSLNDLNVCFNNITMLPESIGNLSSLTHLNICHNNLTQLPASIGNLSLLAHIFALHNQLNILPESIGNLASLIKLNVSGNQLLALPGSIANLTSLTYLGIHDNPITTTEEGKSEIKVRLGRAGLKIDA